MIACSYPDGMACVKSLMVLSTFPPAVLAGRLVLSVRELRGKPVTTTKKELPTHLALIQLTGPLFSSHHDAGSKKSIGYGSAERRANGLMFEHMMRMISCTGSNSTQLSDSGSRFLWAGAQQQGFYSLRRHGKNGRCQRNGR